MGHEAREGFNRNQNLEQMLKANSCIKIRTSVVSEAIHLFSALKNVNPIIKTKWHAHSRSKQVLFNTESINEENGEKLVVVVR